MSLKIDAGLYCLGTFAERYVPEGYHHEVSFEKKVEIIGGINGINGIFAQYPSEPLNNPDRYLKILGDNNLRVSNISINNWDNKKWKNGAFSSSDKELRKQTLEIFKEGIEIAKRLNAHSILLWPAHDGFDYPFQTDYLSAWKYLKELITEIGEYDKSVKIAIEPKPKDPRQRQFIRDTGKLLLLLKEVNLDNVGGALDTGHSFLAGENISESLLLMNNNKKLFQIHLNDNYRDSDSDLMFGSINFFENLELFYYLNQINYKGWLSIDLVSPRDDPVESLAVTVKLIDDYKAMSKKLFENEEEIEINLKNHSFSKNIELIRKIIF